MCHFDDCQYFTPCWWLTPGREASRGRGRTWGKFYRSTEPESKPSCPLHSCPGPVWLGPLRLCCLPLPCTTSAAPSAPSFLLTLWRQLPDENALSETCLAAESFPTRVAGQEVSLRAYLRSEGPETPQALCGFTRESLVPALPPPLHPLRLPLPRAAGQAPRGPRPLHPHTPGMTRAASWWNFW